MKNYKNKAGFTLVEMLIVIAIIGILMGMLIPSLTKGKESARRAQCASNLRQLYLGSMTHATDDVHGGHFPAAYSSEGFNVVDDKWRQTSRAWVNWYKWEEHQNDYGDNPPEELRTYWWGEKGETCIKTGSLYPYMGSDIRVYICPSFKRFIEHDGTASSDNPEYVKGNRSYVMNRQVGWISFLSSQRNKKGMSRRMLYADAAYTKKYGAKWGLKDDGDHSDPLPSGLRNYYTHYYRGCDGMLEYEEERIGDWHRNKGNVVFLDGHNECLSPSLTEDICLGDYEPGKK